MADGSEGISADQKRALFESYDSAKQNVVDAASLLNDVTKRIAEACGQGPFIWRGKEIKLAKRGEGYVARVKAQKAEEII